MKAIFSVIIVSVASMSIIALADSCPITGLDRDGIVNAIATQKSCDAAAKTAMDCYWGSAADSHFVSAALKVCAPETATLPVTYKTKMNAQIDKCQNQFKGQPGMIVISEDADCVLSHTVAAIHSFLPREYALSTRCLNDLAMADATTKAANDILRADLSQLAQKLIEKQNTKSLSGRSVIDHQILGYKLEISNTYDQQIAKSNLSPEMKTAINFDCLHAPTAAQKSADDQCFLGYSHAIGNCHYASKNGDEYLSACIAQPKAALARCCVNFGGSDSCADDSI